jgi:hypothetical protein
MAKRMLRDRIMERNRDDGYGDRRMRDRAMDRMDHGRHEYEPDYRRRGANGRYMRDRADERYEDLYREDHRYRADYGRDYERDRRDHDDGHTKLKLPKEDMKRWGEMLKNADDSEGTHFDKHMLKERIKRMQPKMEGYTEDDLCMAANMLYSDYCEVIRPYISREPEKEADFYLKMAEAFLMDEDAPDGSAKLAMYFFCIADSEE